MIGKIKYVLILTLTFVLIDTSAQNSQVMFFMNLPQSHLFNPALRPSNSVYIGLPVVSGINLNINNNFVNFSDVFIKGQLKDSIITFLHPDYNVDKFLARIKDKNSIEPEVAVQLLGVGFSVGKDGYIFLDINDRIDGNVVLPGDLFKLALKGNEEFVGTRINLSSLRGDLKYYREVGLGYSRNITDKLRIGIKGKLLFGIAGVSIDNRSLGIDVNNDFSHTMDADLMVNISGPVNIHKDTENNIDSIGFDDSKIKTANFLSGNKNMGMGLDFGATYDISDRLKVYASITDLGFIRWKNNVTNLKAKNQFLFSGISMVNVLNGTMTIDSVANLMLDSLKNAFKVSDSKNPFTTRLPFSVTLGGSYNVTQQFSIGLLSYSKVIGNQIHEALTLSANINLGNAFSTSVSYTAENYQYDNLGAGLAFRAGITQFYLVTDRIPIIWNKIINDKSTFPLPENWQTFNLRLGMNLVFGNRPREKSDKPMIQVQ
ncbi:MAG: DUF5723 family protein [Bacteroidales bacterium]